MNKGFLPHPLCNNCIAWRGGRELNTIALFTYFQNNLESKNPNINDTSGRLSLYLMATDNKQVIGTFEMFWQVCVNSFAQLWQLPFPHHVMLSCPLRFALMWIGLIAPIVKYWASIQFIWYFCAVFAILILNLKHYWNLIFFVCFLSGI